MAVPYFRLSGLTGRLWPIRFRLWAVPVFALFVLAAVGCYNPSTGAASVGDSVQFTLPAFPQTGGNAVEVFTEMHYQPSFRTQEGPRLLPPVDSVPVTGREIRYTTADEYFVLTVPARAAQSYDQARAQNLYNINCSVCHGTGLAGDGRITQMTRADGTRVMSKGPFPANLTLDITRSSTDGELFGFISKGGRQGLAATLRGRESTSPMPEFMRLLNEQERWWLVQFLRGKIGR